MSNMILKTFIHEDFVNYKEPSMFIAFPTCSFKCGKENCQNKDLAEAPNIYVDPDKIVEYYIKNPITKAIVFGGLEPFDSADMFALIWRFRDKCEDPIIIYSGYEEEELSKVHMKFLKKYKNIIVKYGRYIPGKKGIYDPVLGVTLSSDNQYAKVIS